jgi:hypothetical protein
MLDRFGLPGLLLGMAELFSPENAVASAIPARSAVFLEDSDQAEARMKRNIKSLVKVL